jgi:uncharacterized membrane protein
MKKKKIHRFNKNEINKMETEQNEQNEINKMETEQTKQNEQDEQTAEQLFKSFVNSFFDGTIFLILFILLCSICIFIGMVLFFMMLLLEKCDPFFDPKIHKSK